MEQDDTRTPSDKVNANPSPHFDELADDDTKMFYDILPATEGLEAFTYLPPREIQYAKKTNQMSRFDRIHNLS